MSKFQNGVGMLKRWLLLFCLPLNSVAGELEPLSMQLRWITQAQFAGYYVALDKGFYQKRGLDVTILPGGPNLDPSQNLRSGFIDVGIEWLPHALLQREQGNQIVNIAQIFDRTGYTLSCRKDRGITSLKDLHGKRIGSWFVGDEVKIAALLRKEQVEAEIYPQNFNLIDLIEGKSDCISTMRYNEYLTLLEQGMREDEIVTFDFDQLGVATLEDGLYVREDLLQDPLMRSRLTRYLAATIEGWRYTLDHPEEALEIVLDNDPTGALDEAHQRAMLNVVLGLLHVDRDKIGQLSERLYLQNVEQLLDGKVITYHPARGAYSDKIWKAVQSLSK